MQLRPPGQSGRLNPWVMALVVFGVTLACYWPALTGTILWDDPAHVTKPELRSWSGLARIWTDASSTQQYYPVLFSAFWIEHRLWGDATLGYHLVNVLLHAAAACLLAGVLRRLWAAPAPTGPPAGRGVPPGAEWFAALLFATHPICVESVAWITEQKNTLSTFFYLLAGGAYLNFFLHRRLRDYGVASALFLLALGSKTATTTLPAALLVVIWWRQGTLSWRRDVRPLAPWLVAAVAMGLFTSWVERKVIGAEGAAFDLSAVERVLLAGRSIWFYTLKLVWPADLNFFYPRWDVASASSGWAGYVIAAVVVTLVLWALRHRSRGPLAAWLLLVGSLSPILGFFNVYFFTFSYVNDHFLYLASLGPIAALAGGVALVLAETRPAGRTLGLVAGGLLLITLAALTFRQSGLYRDNETLFRATVAKNPESWMGHHILGFALAKSPDRRPEAIAQFQQALRLNPDYPDAHLSLAVELSRLPGRKAEAIEHYNRALELRPNYAEAHNGLAVALASETGHSAEVLAHYEAAVRLKPDFAEAHANLADTLAKLPGREPEAMAHYGEALRLNPSHAIGHCHLAYLLMQIRGRETEALGHYETALRLQPDYLEAHNGLAIACVQLGRFDRAKAEWQAALQLNPNYETARKNLRLLEQMTP